MNKHNQTSNILLKYKYTPICLHLFIKFTRLGIEDKFNICSGSVKQTRAICKEIELQCLIPALKCPPKDSDFITDAYILGFNSQFGFAYYSKSATLHFIMNNNDTICTPELKGNNP